ncbi:hypothetical protein PMAYCL1PPCAC_29094, partial [Pristionchus mayeri]
MASNTPFLRWLHNLECKPGLVNSYYYAAFSDKLRGILSEKDDCERNELSRNRRISLEKFLQFNYLEEIEKERRENTESPLMTESLIGLLKLVRPDKNIRNDNYMNELRDFVSSLFTGKTEKLFPAHKQFHELSSELKLWLLHSLLLSISDAPHNFGRRPFPLHHPRPIGRDSTGNLYFIVNHQLLYVQYGTKLQEMTRVDEERNISSLERSILRLPRWKLIAYSEANIGRIQMLLETFDEEGIANRINEEIKNKIMDEEEKKAREMEKEFDSEQFQRGNSLRKSRTQLRKPPSVDSMEDEQSHSGQSESHSSISAKNGGITIQRGTVHQRVDLPPPSIPLKEVPIRGDNLKSIRCMYFPNCRRSDDDCHFVHPRVKCTNFGRESCPGVFCRFLH